MCVLGWRILARSRVYCVSLGVIVLIWMFFFAYCTLWSCLPFDIIRGDKDLAVVLVPFGSSVLRFRCMCTKPD